MLFFIFFFLGSSILHCFPYALERWKFVFLFFCESGGRKLARFIKAYLSLSCIGLASIRLSATDQNMYTISFFDTSIGNLYLKAKKYTQRVGNGYRFLNIIDFFLKIPSNFVCSKACFGLKFFFRWHTVQGENQRTYICLESLTLHCCKSSERFGLKCKFSLASNKYIPCIGLV
jgi:hypothetical protein